MFDAWVKDYWRRANGQGNHPFLRCDMQDTYKHFKGPRKPFQ